MGAVSHMIMMQLAGQGDEEHPLWLYSGEEKKNQHFTIQSGCFPICQHVSCIIAASEAHMLECIGSISLKREALEILSDLAQLRRTKFEMGTPRQDSSLFWFCSFVMHSLHKTKHVLSHIGCYKNRFFWESRLWLARWKSSERVYYSTQLHCVPKHEKSSMSQALFMM